MVGYNKDKLIDFSSVMDEYDVEKYISRQKVRASYYKIVIEDIFAIEKFKYDVVSELLMLFMVDLKKMPSNEKKTYIDIFENIISHRMNRALYSQKNISSILRKPSDVPTIQLMSLDSISNSKYENIIAYFMIYFSMDLENLLVRKSRQIYMIEQKLFAGNSFASLGDIIDEL